jgi:hypothetical protein
MPPAALGMPDVRVRGHVLYIIHTNTHTHTNIPPAALGMPDVRVRGRESRWEK